MPEREPVAGPADRVLRIAANVVYSVAGVLLAAGAVIVLVAVTWHLAMDVGHGVEKGVVVALDGLLLVFILLELLAGVRATMRERKLVLLPAMAGFLVRRNESEPQEEDEAGGG